MPRTDLRRNGSRGWRDRYPRLIVLLASVALGLLAGFGYARNDEMTRGVIAVVLMTLFGAVAALSKDEFFVADSPEADERQRSMGADASRIALSCVMFVAVAGFMWEIYTGESPGAFTLICVVGALSYGFAFAYLRRRR